MFKPKRACRKPGCSALTSARYCDEHIPKRPSARLAGYTSRWDEYSKRFLSTHPFCTDLFGLHRGKRVQATVTGHRVAHKGNPELMWAQSNHYPLCSSCNAYQCVKEEGGFGNAVRREQ